MTGIINYIRQRKILVIFAFSLVLFITYFGIIEKLSFKINGDFYAMMSTVSACKNYLAGNFDKNVFPDALIFSPHTNVISWLITLISNLFGWQTFYIFCLIGLINIVFFIFSFDYFLASLKLNSKKRALIVILSIIIVPTTFNINYLGDGIFTLSDILVTAFGWRLVGFSLFFIALGIILNQHQTVNWKKLLSLIAVSLLLANISLLNYIILLSFILVYFLFQLICRQYSRDFFLIILSILTGGILNFAIWPFYNFYYLIIKSYQDFQSSPITQTPQDYIVNSTTYYLNILSISLLGYLAIMKEKQRFIKTVIIVSTAIIAISLLTPILKIPLFWRFATPLKIFLIITFVKNYQMSIKNYFSATAVSLMAFLFLLYTYKMLDSIKQRNDSQLDLYNRIKQINLSDGLILSDERTSNVIQAIDSNKIYAIPKGHIANRQTAQLNLEKTSRLNEILKTYDYKKINQFMIENNVRYVVINKTTPFVDTFKLISKNDFSFYPKITQTDDLTIIKITPIER